MIRLLLSRAMGSISTRAFYSLWIRASAVSLIGWMAFTAEKSWIAEAGLTFILILLLVGGIVLLAFGIRDLIRDFLRFLRVHTEKNGHAPL